MAFGHTTSQILYAAVRLGVPDALAGDAMPVGKLADRVDVDLDGLTRLVRALVVLGVVEEVEAGQVTLAEAGRPLCADHPRSMRASVLLLGDPVVWQAWGTLTEAVRTGAAAFDHAHVVDIGGGNGTLLAAVLAAAPDARGILFDTAEGAAGADDTFRRAGLSDRWLVAHGDFFDAVPEADVMLVKGILHDWDDDRCVALLRNCRRSIAADGRLLVLEPVLPDRLGGAEAGAVAMSDIAMLVYTGGRERNRAEYARLLAAGGFDLADVTPPLAGSAIRVLVARPR
jgi:hypothetical protein